MTVGRYRTESIGNAEVMCEALVNRRYRVQVIWSNGPCYRVLIQDEFGSWVKIRCWSDHDERVFPKTAARRGHELTQIIKAQECIR